MSLCAQKLQDEGKVRVVASARAKRATFRVNSKGRYIRLSVPKGVKPSLIVDIINAHSGWIEKQLTELDKRLSFEDGAIIPIFDHEVRLSHCADGRTGFDAEYTQLSISGDLEQFGRRCERFLKRYCRDTLSEYVSEKVALLPDVKVTGVSVKETTSQWGSCSRAGKLSFSWRLIFAPNYVADYVVGHEVAHLKHMNHSADFWELCDQLTAYRVDAERWLKKHGKDLYAYGL